MVAFIGSFFLIYLFGCIEAQIYSRSGAALAIADAISGWINIDKMPQQRKQLMAMLILTLIGTVLAYGGIIVTVVIILLYPISLSLLEKADIPKKFVLGILANGTFTFALTGPGSPQTTNIVAMNFLGTSSTSGLVAGIIGSLAELAVTLFVLNAMINRARAAGEHFAYHEKDEVYAPGREKPGFLLAVFPLAAVFLLFIVFGVRIEYALAAGAVLSLAAFWKYLREEGVQPVLNAGALSSISPVFTVGAIVGFAGIVTSTEAFSQIVAGIVEIPLPPVVLLIICVAITCALTGGSSTGLLVCLPVMAPVFIDQLGMDLELVHRVSTFAGSILDTLPYSGSILMLLPVCHMKLKEIYPAMFVTTVLSTLVGTVVIALIMTLFPMLP
jgi:H+/gluconate symporter-like permease